MRLTLPDPVSPVQSLTFEYPDAPFEALTRWLLAVPIWQRSSQQLSDRLSDFKLELATLRAAGRAHAVGTAPVEPVVAVAPAPDRMAKARAAAAAKRAAAKAAKAATP